MKKVISVMALLFLVSCSSASLRAEPQVGEPAPDFTLSDISGETTTLSGLKGSYVVLEWVNYDCPFVKKQYDSGNVPSLQKELAGKGVTWLSICSSVEGKQGNFTDDQIKGKLNTYSAAPAAYLKDSDGSVGKLYGAKTTPHMFVVNPDGVLIYKGAIDNHPVVETEGLSQARNYVKAALDSAQKGEPVAESSTTAYGCSVKY